MNNGSGISQSTANAAFTRASNTKTAVSVDFGGAGSNNSFENTLQQARQKVARSTQERPAPPNPREPSTPRPAAAAAKDSAPLRAEQATEKRPAAANKNEPDTSPSKPLTTENTELAAVEETSTAAPLTDASQTALPLEDTAPGVLLLANGVPDQVVTDETDPLDGESLLAEVDTEEPLPEELLKPEEETDAPVEEEPVAIAVETDEAAPTPQVALQGAPANARTDAAANTSESAVLTANKVTVEAGKSSGAPVVDDSIAGADDGLPAEEGLLARASGSASRTSLPTDANTAPPAETRTAPPTTAVIAETTRAAESLAVTGRGFTVQSQVGVPMGHPQWNQAVVNRVMWLSAQNLPSAEIRLDPPELGPLQVRIQVQNDHVQVNFVSQNPNVRDVLDQQANRLREMFAENGMSLDVGVSDQAFSRRDQEQSSGGGNGSNAEPGDEEEQAATARIIRLVDHYA
ncbi:flagellar hook-length control protein FliK [Cellvibrio polysaccharolyticus]|uniref:Flagellar hook-length control protein-like C-terminal domain-containing protein n=1 Tax=Cellvibrio polysaccharolyticus TaxID=2082724 RepID=A0A928YTV7_9GAMM|nr:flagellar hook-length control protein FliK [Cellvibrio polysaccharolyticus]MBE8717404.1 hypothetical protein [Cellvibrio polysaccharolyticus]